MNIDPLHDPKSFIQQVLINEIGQITKSNVYLSFVLISIAIEFLGKCIDDDTDNWNEERKAKVHFNLAIEKLMPQYEKHNLYQLLRCGLAHYLAPQVGLGLSERKNGTTHLMVVDGALILNIEDFYSDFTKACEEVIGGIDNKIYKNQKVYQPFIVVKSG